MRNITLLVLVFVTMSGMAQKGFELIIIDNIGRSDTVVFANAIQNATSGIDVEFAEFDLYNIEMDSVEIRSVQRDSASHICLTKSIFEDPEEPLFFNENIDLERDFRAGWSSKDDNFEFLINAVEYPITIIADFTKYYPGDLWFTHLFLVGENCKGIGALEYWYPPSEPDTLIIDSVANLKGIIVKMEHEVGVNEKSNNVLFNISPNPTSDSFVLNITKGNTHNAEIVIYSSDGKILVKNNVYGLSNIEIDMSIYKKGIYLVQLRDSNGSVYTSKIVKK